MVTFRGHEPGISGYWTQFVKRFFSPLYLSISMNVIVFICAAFSFLPNIMHNNTGGVFILPTSINSTAAETLTDDYYATFEDTHKLLNTWTVMISLNFSVGAAGIIME